jgi:hypothetical protein
MLYFTYSWHNIFTVHVPSLITVELSSYNSQQMLKISYSWIIARMDTFRYALPHPFKILERLRPVQRASKLRWLVSAYFQLELNTVGVLSVPTHTNLTDWGPRTLTSLPQKLFADVRIYMKLYPCFVWGIQWWILYKHFRYTLYMEKPYPTCYYQYSFPCNCKSRGGCEQHLSHLTPNLNRCNLHCSNSFITVLNDYGQKYFWNSAKQISCRSK